MCEWVKRGLCVRVVLTHIRHYAAKGGGFLIGDLWSSFNCITITIGSSLNYINRGVQPSHCPTSMQQGLRQGLQNVWQPKSIKHCLTHKIN